MEKTLLCACRQVYLAVYLEARVLVLGTKVMKTATKAQKDVATIMPRQDAQH